MTRRRAVVNSVMRTILDNRSARSGIRAAATFGFTGLELPEPKAPIEFRRPRSDWEDKEGEAGREAFNKAEAKRARKAAKLRAAQESRNESNR